MLLRQIQVDPVCMGVGTYACVCPALLPHHVKLLLVVMVMVIMMVAVVVVLLVCCCCYCPKFTLPTITQPPTGEGPAFWPAVPPPRVPV